MPLTIAEADGLFRFTGDTYNFRDLIKALTGARWVAAEKTWTAPASSDLTAIRARMDEHAASTAFWAAEAAKRAYLSQPRETWTKEQWQSYCASWPRRRGNIDRCCSHATSFTQYDYQGPTCYDCPRHGKTYNSYCGD
jgi:urease accessory protein UreH